jgi:hypothetical protein
MKEVNNGYVRSLRKYVYLLYTNLILVVGLLSSMHSVYLVSGTGGCESAAEFPSLKVPFFLLCFFPCSLSFLCGIVDLLASTTRTTRGLSWKKKQSCNRGAGREEKATITKVQPSSQKVARGRKLAFANHGQK